MKKEIIIILISFISLKTFSQTRFLTFNENESKIKISDKELIIPIKYTITYDSINNMDDYIVEILSNDGNTSIERKNYKLLSNINRLSNLKNGENEFYLKFSLNDKILENRHISLNTIIKLKDSLIEKNENIHKIIVQPEDDKLSGYEYLIYVGTNFDLVDGIQANNIFYASNILKKPNEEDNNIGFYFSLYGNRALTEIDSTSTRLKTEIESINDESSRIILKNELLKTTTTVDNIGASFSTLIDFSKNKNDKKKTKLYYSPTLEFVYKRTRVNIESTGNILNDTIVVNEVIDPLQSSISQFPINNYSFNEYNVGLGALGVFLVHESKEISVRFQGTIGYLGNYLVDFQRNTRLRNVELTHDLFFNARAWITEPTTGVTLQAEINNSLINSNPQIVVTLSKAFDFHKINSIFSPIVPE